MELESLKTALEDRVRSVPCGSDLLTSSARAVSVLSKIERSVRWEIGFACAFLFFCMLSLILTEEAFYKIFLGMLAVYSSAFLLQLHPILKQSKQATDSIKPVKKCVEESLAVVTDFVKLYERLTAWFLPLVFLAAMSAGFITEYARSGSLASIPFYTILLAVPLVAGWIWLMRRFSKWWLKRLYGDYITMLHLQLREITDESGDA